MGTDIVCWAERKDDETGEWAVVVENMFANRNYTLFQWLAGVRMRDHVHLHPLSQPKRLS